MTDPDPASSPAPSDRPTTVQAPSLADRYGRARSRTPQAVQQTAGGAGETTWDTPVGDHWDEDEGAGRRPKLSVGARIAIALALAAGVALAAWFTVVDTQRDPVTFTDVGFSVTSPEEIDVTFDVSLPAGSDAVCTVTALSKNFAEVGAVDVEVSHEEAGTSRHTVKVATTELATTGVVDRCELR